MGANSYSFNSILHNPTAAWLRYRAACGRKKAGRCGPAFFGGKWRSGMPAAPGVHRTLPREWTQWPDAPDAPKPVSERTCCAANSERSRAALALRSVMENSHTPKKPMVIENRAGEV